jgi:DNA-binding PucR family transcriptional regulator
MSRLQDLVDELSLSLRRGVSVDDAQFRLLAYSARVGGADPVEQQTILERRAPAAVADWCRAHAVADCRSYVRVPASEKLALRSTRIAVPVRRRDALLAYLWIFDPDDSLADDRLDEAIATAVEIGEFLSQQPMLEADRRIREQAACAALLDPAAGDAATEELATSGLLVRGAAFQVIVVELDENQLDSHHDNAVLSLDRARRKAAAGAAICGLVHGHPAMIVSSLDDGQHAKVIDRVSAAIADCNPDGWHLGIGSLERALRDVHRSFEAACTALRIRSMASEVGDPVRWDELGAWRLVACIPESPLAHSALHPGLARLEAASKETSLIETLDSYLNHGGDARATSEALFIHRASLYARLKRIETIAGVDLNNGEESLAVHLSLKVSRWLAYQRETANRS